MLRENGPIANDDERYEEWTREELYQRAKQLGINGRSEMDKDELIEVLQDH
jgi:hypothetical protein